MDQEIAIGGGIIGAIITAFLGMMLLGYVSNNNAHACRLQAMQAKYDAAQIAQICGK